MEKENATQKIKTQNRFTKKTISTLLFTCAFFIIHFINKRNIVALNISSYFCLYAAVLIGTEPLNKYRIFKPIHIILWTPMVVVLLITNTFKILSSIYFMYIISFAIGYLPLYLFQNFLSVEFSYNEWIFYTFTLAAIIATTWGNMLTKFWLLTEEKEDRKLLHETSLKLINQKKTRILIFVLYFLALIISNITSLRNIPIFETENIDKTIISSFGVYVAFDRILSNWKTIKSKEGNSKINWQYILFGEIRKI